MARDWSSLMRGQGESSSVCRDLSVINTVSGDGSDWVLLSASSDRPNIWTHGHTDTSTTRTHRNVYNTDTHLHTDTQTRIHTDTNLHMDTQIGLQRGHTSSHGHTSTHGHTDTFTTRTHKLIYNMDTHTRLQNGHTDAFTTRTHRLIYNVDTQTHLHTDTQTRL